MEDNRGKEVERIIDIILKLDEKDVQKVEIYLQGMVAGLKDRKREEVKAG